MIRRSNNSVHDYSNRIPRICPTMMTNIILNIICSYQPTISHPIHRKRNRTSMWRVLSRKSNIKRILLTTLLNTICNRSNSSTIAASNRIKQPTRINPLKTKRRLLYLKTQFVPRSKHFSSRL